MRASTVILSPRPEPSIYQGTGSDRRESEQRPVWREQPRPMPSGTNAASFANTRVSRLQSERPVQPSVQPSQASRSITRHIEDVANQTSRHLLRRVLRKFLLMCPTFSSLFCLVRRRQRRLFSSASPKFQLFWIACAAWEQTTRHECGVRS